MMPNTVADPMTYEEIPYASKQGIFGAEQGIKTADQRIFRPDQGILIWGCPAGTFAAGERQTRRPEPLCLAPLLFGTALVVA